ncbi:MAG: hypothetical protein AAF570_15040, partial [Bacteroidota bacterium]
MKRILAAVISCLLTVSAICQVPPDIQQASDSLDQVLHSSAGIRAKTSAYTAKIHHGTAYYFDSVMVWANANIDMATQDGDPDAQGDASLVMAKLASNGFPTDAPQLTYALKAVDFYNAGKDKGKLARAQMFAASAFVQVGKADSAQIMAELALANSKQLDNRKDKVEFHRTHKELLMLSGDFVKADSVMEIMAGLLDPESEQGIKLVLDRCQAKNLIGEPMQALEFVLEAQRRCEKVNDVYNLSRAYEFRSHIHSALYEDEAAKDFALKALRTAIATKNRELVSHYNTTAVMYQNLKVMDSAAYYFEELVAKMGDKISPLNKLSIRSSMAKCYLESGMLEKARTAFDEMDPAGIEQLPDYH